MLPDLESERLLLRPRTVDDLDATARMNADPRVMRHIAAIGDPAMGRDAVAARSFTHIEFGLGYWSVFARSEPDCFTGYVGLIPEGDSEREVQLSYRFEAAHWGRGYAFEAAERLLRHGFAALGLARVTVVTHPENAASLRLAQRLGFKPGAGATVLIGAPPVEAARLSLSSQDSVTPPVV